MRAISAVALVGCASLSGACIGAAENSSWYVGAFAIMAAGVLFAAAYEARP